MKRILIPTDFSDNSWNTVLYAMQLYKGTTCTFYVLHAYDLSSVQLATTISSQRIGYLYDSVRVQSQEGLKTVLEDIKNSRTDAAHSFVTISKPGSLTHAIQEVITKDYFDMIVIGTKGATGAKEIFLGSNTHNVIKNVNNCPILVIPEMYTFKGISEIGFATDFKRIYHRSEIAPVLHLSKSYDATIRMIHIYDQPELGSIQSYNSSSLEHFFKSVKYDFHVIPDFSTLENAVDLFISDLKIDILVMINYEHSFIKRLLREEVIKKITFHTTIPFLIIPADT